MGATTDAETIHQERLEGTHRNTHVLKHAERSFKTSICSDTNEVMKLVAAIQKCATHVRKLVEVVLACTELWNELVRYQSMDMILKYILILFGNSF